MIIQKEVKFALGLTVIFTLLAAAIFVYEGEKKDQGENDPGTGTVASTDKEPGFEQESEPSDHKGPDTDTSVTEPGPADTEHVIEFPEPDNTEDDGFKTKETDIGVSEPDIKETDVKKEPDVSSGTDDTRTSEDITEPEVKNKVITINDDITLPDIDPEDKEKEEKEKRTEDDPFAGITETVEETQTKAVGGTEYTIKKGDTLSKIAARIYGRAHLYTIIKDANPHIIPNEMMPGQKIIIPKYTPKVKTSPAALPEDKNTFPEGVMVYTVKRGDTLSTISKKFYGTSTKWQKIMKANSIRDEYNVPAGKKIIIPDVKPEPKMSEEDTDLPDLSNLPSADDTPSLPDTGESKIHTVAEGETLWSIAQLYFGDGMKFKDIKRANQSINPDRIIAGQKIKIPGITINADSEGAEYFVYTVEEGDYLSTIAEKFLGSPKRWREITGLNSGLNPNRIYPGQKIKIPGAGPSSKGISSREDLPDIPAGSESGLTGYVGSSSRGGKTYTVQQGDTLSEIAMKIYGSVKYMQNIIDANPHIKNRDSLYVGAKLKLPDIRISAPSQPHTAQEPAVRKTPVSGGESYLDNKKSSGDKYVSPIERGFGR